MKTVRKYLIDLIMFVMCAGIFPMIAMKSQYIYQAVSEIHNYTSNGSMQYCSGNQSASSEEDTTVAADVSRISLYLALAGGIPMICASLFLGSWSDKVGRKLPLSLNVIGICIACTMQAFIIYFRLPLYTLLINEFFLGLSGSFITLLNLSMAYLSDIVEPENRSIRYTLLESILGFGGGMSSFATGYWIKADGFVPTSIFAACCTFSGFILVPFLPTKSESICGVVSADEEKQKQAHVNENLFCHSNDESKAIINNTDNHDRKSTSNSSVLLRMKSIWRIYFTEYSICNICNLEDKGQTCCHGGGLRKGRVWRMWFYVMTFSLYIYTVFGASAFETMYFLSYPLCFSPVLLGVRTGLSFFLVFLGPFILKFFQSVLHWSNQFIILVLLTAAVAKMIVYAFADTAYLVFIAATISVLTNITAPILRYKISTLVSSSEQGSALSFISGTESLTNMIGMITFLFLYPATLHIARGFAWMYCAVILAIPLALMIAIWIVDKRKTEASIAEERSPLLS